MIRFGPAGNSASFYAAGHKGTMETAAWLSQRGLDAFEYSFGRGVNIRDELAGAIGGEMEKYGIAVSCHAPYYINLCNPDDGAAVKSFQYIEKSIRSVKLMGGDRIIFHPGHINKDGAAASQKLALARMQVLLKYLDERGLCGYYLCPETMGKHSQLGTYQQVIELCNLDKRLIPAFDFGHIHTYYNGGLKAKDDYKRIIDYTLCSLGEEKTENMHIHFSKIQYGAKGEIRHLDFSDTVYGPEFEPLAETLFEYKLQPRVICESAENMAEDALQMKAIYDRMRNKG